MEFEYTVDLNGTPAEAYEFFSKLENLYSWQPTLNSIEVIEGNRDTAGSVSKLVYHEGKKKIQIVEIINDMRPPEFFSSTSTDILGTVRNYTENYFEPYNDATTLRVVCQFTLNGFLMRLTKPFIRGSIQKRLEEDMERLRLAFAEYQLAQQSAATAPAQDKPKKASKSKKKKSAKKSKKKKSKKSKK